MCHSWKRWVSELTRRLVLTRLFKINPTSEVLQSIDACTLMLVTELPLRVPSLSGALPLVTLRTSAHALQLRTA